MKDSLTFKKKNRDGPYIDIVIVRFWVRIR